MVKLPDEFKDNIRKIIEEVLDSDLSSGRIEELSGKWIECIKGLLEYNRITYSEQELEEIKNIFLERLELIRRNRDSAAQDEEKV
ncbi:MAG: hypothetical protein QXF28_05615 [Nitrososphaerota archaeon]